MSPDNLITNKQVDAGTLPESQRENRPQVSAEGQAAAKRIAAARAERNANPTSVTADQLSQPVSQVTVPQPQVAETTPVNQNMVRGVQSGTQNFITAQSEEATRLAESRQLQNDLLGEGTLSDFRTERENAFGIPENMRMLQDLDLQMADMDTESNITQTRIGQGNSISQGNREITQEQRENAVRQAGTAARAAILQGNIETASALVSQAVQTAYQDRTLRNSNLINQINSLQGVVDGQTAQLLETDKRKYEADQAVIQRVADAVDDAMNSGAATQEDIRTLTDPKLSDEDRLAAAQGIVSRGQTQLRDLDVRATEASIASSQASTANSRDAINSRALDRQAAAAKDAEIKAAIASGAVVLNADQQDTAMKLSKDFVSQSSDFKKQVDAYNRIVSSAEDPSAAGDVAVVFNYMKMLDPGSVVRESEFALAASTGSLDEAIQNKFGKVATGEILGFTRDDFVDRAGKIYSGSLEQQIDLEETMRDQAIKLYGMPQNAADLIISDVRATGAVSEVVFGLTMDGMSDEQLLELTNGGLLPKQ